MSVSVTVGALTIVAEEETSLALLHLRETIADSQCWRACVALPRSIWPDVKALADAGTAGRAAALAAIDFDRLDDEGLGAGPGSEYPKLIIRPMDDSDIEAMGTNVWDVRGMFTMYVELPVPTDYRGSPRLATIDFWNKVDRIHREMREQEGAAERLDIDRIERGPSGEIDPDINNQRRERFALFVVRYGGAA